MKIAVFGGTPIDTQMGCRLLETKNTEIFSVAISQSPEQQTQFQTSNLTTKNTVIRQKIEQAKQNGCQAIFVYCNSLSASIDFPHLEKEYHIPILTPFSAYESYAKKFKKVGILAANAQGAAGIERVFVQKNPALRVFSITNLDWVTAVEKQLAPDDIASSFGLIESIRFFEQQQVDAIIIGCTHFPYFLAEYQHQTTIPCLNPDDALRTTLTQLMEVD